MALFGPKSKEYGDLNRKSIGELNTTVEEQEKELQTPFAGSNPGLVPTSDETTQAKYLRGDGEWATPAGGGGGTEDYEDLTNKPAIDGTTLDKDSTAEGLGLAKKDEIPTKTSDLDNDSGYLTSETDPTVPSWAKQQNPPTPATFDGEHAGLVPAPASGDSGKYLKADGTWGTPSGGGSSSMNYSTDEQVVGTWIDGKPIYQKTFSIDATLAGSSWTWYDTGITAADYNIKSIIDGELLTVNNLPHCALGWDLTYVNNHISFISYWPGINIITMTLRYTKTTD